MVRRENNFRVFFSFLMFEILEHLLYILFTSSGKPASPSIPNVVTVGKSYVDLEWDKPFKDGGSKITGKIGIFSLFVLRFYGPVNTITVMSDNFPTWISGREKMAVEITSWPCDIRHADKYWSRPKVSELR